MDRKNRYISFTLRVIHNQVKDIISKTVPKSDIAPQTQLQGGILGYLFHHRDSAVYQKDIEKEFRISRATATNTLQVMEKRGLIVRRSLDKDARLKRILMTEAAATNHARVEEHIREMNERMLQGMTPEDILGQVCGSLGVVFMETAEVSYKCYCSRERVESALISLGREELAQIMEEGKPFPVECQFCDTVYTFTPENVAELLKKI